MSIDSGDQNERGSLGIRLASLLFDRTILLLVIMFAIAIALLMWHRARLEHRLVETTAVAEAQRYSEALATFRTLYTREVVGTVAKHGITVTHDYGDQKHGGKAIPLPATLSMEIGNEMAEKGLGGRTALYSGFPFPHREDQWRERDQFAKDAWEALNDDKDEPVHRFERRGGKRWLRYARADLMRPACVHCHNTHPETPKTDWKVGDVRGVLEVSVPLDSAEAAATDNLEESLTLTIGLGGLGLVCLVIVIARLRRSSVELGQRVQERTVDLSEANERLTQQSEELQRSNVALEQSYAELDEFTFVASHDLQEPLRKLVSYSELLEEDLGDKLTGEAKEDLGFITDAASRMRTLVQDLLTLSRPGRAEIERVRFPLDQSVRLALEALEISVKETRPDISRDDLPDVWGDASLLSQVYQNLIGNALKFADDHQPLIRLTAEADSGHWILGVCDNGIGIDPKYSEKIFAPFQRLHGRGEYSGSGIGLAICQKIVKRHNGRIWVESELGKGAHFKFTIGEKGTYDQEGKQDE